MADDFEMVCFMCMRPKSRCDGMVSLGGNICVCTDCLQKTLDMAQNLNLSPDMLNGMPNLFSNIPGSMPNVTDNNEDKKESADSVKESPVEEMSFDTDSEDAPEDTPEENEKEEKEDSPKGGRIPNGFPNVSFINLNDMFGGMAGRNRQPQKKKKPLEPIDLKKIPQPHMIKEQLDQYVIGQDHAKKVISVAVYNHYKRVATGTMDEIEIEKSNILLIGPTGSGKTYLVKTLAKLLDVPLAIADATSLTEAGYIGDDIESVVTKLLAAADNDVEKAERGIIFIDEIDKIAKKKQTTSRDVSGESVQQGMLKLLEGAEVEVPIGSNSKNAMVPLATVNTRNILFICGGAFPDLEEIIKQRLSKQTSIGYTAELKDKWDKEKNILSKVTVEDVKKFGMIPEFVGRLPIICTLEGLNKEMLVQILKEPKNAILKQYQKLLGLDEVNLLFNEDALEAIAEKALQKDTGARALRAIIEEFMLDIMYEIPKDKNIGTVTITREYIEGTGGPVIELRELPVITDKSEE